MMPEISLVGVLIVAAVAFVVLESFIRAPEIVADEPPQPVES
jgi:hypothetical protein